MTELVLDKSTTTPRCRRVKINRRFYEERAGIPKLLFRQGTSKWLQDQFRLSTTRPEPASSFPQRGFRDRGQSSG
jgi:hypothetical protein